MAKKMEHMQKLELKLTSTTKELEEYKTLTQNNYESLKNSQSDKMNNLKVWLKKTDEEIIECKKAIKKKEEITKENLLNIILDGVKLGMQGFESTILCNQLIVLNTELKLYGWSIYLNELVANYGELESEPFHATSNLYYLLLSVEYDVYYDSLDIYLHRCRDYDEEEGESRPPNGSNTRYML